jgi:AcrR family transcriptional regulator
MSQAGLLHHFESKDALLTAVLRHRDERSGSLFSQARGIEFLVSAVEAVRVTERGTAELYCVLSAEATAPGHPAHDYFTERYAWLRSVLTDAFERMASAGVRRACVIACHGQSISPARELAEAGRLLETRDEFGWQRARQHLAVRAQCLAVLVPARGGEDEVDSPAVVDAIASLYQAVPFQPVGKPG